MTTLKEIAEKFNEERRNKIISYASDVVSNRSNTNISNAISVPATNVEVYVPKQEVGVPIVNVPKQTINVLQPEPHVTNIIDVPKQDVPQVLVNVDVPQQLIPAPIVNVDVPQQNPEINVNLVVPKDAIKVEVVMPKVAKKDKPPTKAHIKHADGRTSEIDLE